MENEEKKTTKAKLEASKGGVHYDKQSKSWAFRAIRDGKDVRKKGFATKTEAKEARISFLAKHKEEKNKGPDSDTNIKLKDVYEHYMKFGSVEKRPGTLRKQKSIWENHVGPEFGNRIMISIGVGELKNYLIQL